jgi:hypothetical protein
MDVGSARHMVSAPVPAKTTRRSRSPLVGRTVNTLLILCALVVGWRIRDEYLINAEYGLGYALGIGGGVMMLLLLVYPLRKRLQRTPLLIFSTPVWFRIHMALGLLGPLFILYHCNFSLGSTNSNIALFSMLLMVTSGLVGRYIYTKIHADLRGKRVQLKDLLANKILLRDALTEGSAGRVVLVSNTLIDELQRFENAVAQRDQASGSLRRIIDLSVATRRARNKLDELLQQDQLQNIAYQNLPSSERKRQLRAVREAIADYLATVRRVAELAFFERLFSLWHMMHLPIFFMLIVAGFVHVYAVHAY